MTLETVEGILGPGEEVDQVPLVSREGGIKGVVQGERLFLWRWSSLFGAEERFYISFTDNKVVEKHWSTSNWF
jgi:hypothetical protein